MCAVELYLCDELTSQHLSSWPYVELTLKVSTEWPVSGTYNRQPATGKQETAAGTCLHLHLTGNRYWQQKNNTVKMESDGKLKCRSSDPWAVAVCASTTKDVWNWPAPVSFYSCCDILYTTRHISKIHSHIILLIETLFCPSTPLLRYWQNY